MAVAKTSFKYNEGMNIILSLIIGIIYLVAAVIAVGFALAALILCAFDLAMRLWIWRNGVNGEAMVDHVEKRGEVRTTATYAWYDYRVDGQTYARQKAEISRRAYGQLRSGAVDSLPIRYDPTDPILSYPWAWAISYGKGLIGLLVVVGLAVPLLLARPTDSTQGLAAFALLLVIMVWAIGLIYAYTHPRRAFNFLTTLEQDGASRTLFRRIFKSNDEN